MAGLEPTTSCSQSTHSTKLSYIPRILGTKQDVARRFILSSSNLEYPIGFEPTWSLRSPDLQSSAFNHSATGTWCFADLLRGFSERNLDSAPTAWRRLLCGAESRSRTDDLLITNQLLWPTELSRPWISVWCRTERPSAIPRIDRATP